MRLWREGMVEGRGISNRSYVLAVETGLRELADNLARLLRFGFAEAE